MEGALEDEVKWAMSCTPNLALFISIIAGFTSFFWEQAIFTGYPNFPSETGSMHDGSWTFINMMQNHQWLIPYDIYKLVCWQS